MAYLSYFRKNTCLFIAVFILFITATAQQAADPEIEKRKKRISEATTVSEKIRQMGFLSNSYKFRRNFEQSDSVLKEAMVLAEKDRSPKALFYAHHIYLFGSYRAAYPVSKQTEILEHLQTAYTIASENNLKNEEVSALESLGTYYVSVLNYSKALEYLNKADLNDEKISDSTRFQFYASKSEYYGAVKNNIEAFKSILNARKYAARSKIKRLDALSLRILGSVYKQTGQYEKALSTFQDEMEAVKKDNSEDRRSISNTGWQIGTVYNLMGDKKKAEEQWLLALKQADSLNDNFDKNAIAYSLLVFYFEQKNGSSANEIENKYNIINRTLSSGDTAFYYYYRGQLFEASGIKDSVIFYYQKAISLSETSKDQVKFISLYKYIAPYYRSIGAKSEGLAMIQKALAINDSAKILSHYPDIYKELDSAWQAAGDFKNAYLAREKYHTYTDSIAQQNRKDDLLRLEIAAEEERMAKEETELAQAKSKRHNIQYQGIVIGCMVLLIGLLTLGFFSVPKWLIRAAGFLTFIFLFEFILMLLDKKIMAITNGEPVPKLMIKILIGCLLIPLHHYVEKKVIHFLQSRKLHRLKTVFKDAPPQVTEE